MTIYFAEMGDWIKIGYTAAEDATGRIRQLQTGQPQRIKLLGTIPGGRDAESGLHEEFADCRIGGEWFEKKSLLSIVMFLIENQHPWYFCRTKERIYAAWQKAFSPEGNADLSAYDDCPCAQWDREKKTKNLSKEERSKLAKAFSRRLKSHREKHGIDPYREERLKTHFFGGGIHPYIAVWAA